MHEFEGEDGIEGFIRDLAKKQESQQKLAKEYTDKIGKMNDEIEHEVLMSLYSKLGDSHHSYYSIFNGCAAFIKVIDSMREEFEKLPHGIKQILFDHLEKVLEWEKKADSCAEEGRLKIREAAGIDDDD